MGKNIAFKLKMRNGAEVKNLDALRKNFDLESVVKHYADGLLLSWLRGCHYSEEAEKVEKINKESEDFMKELCEILGVPFSEAEAQKISLSDIEQKNAKVAYMKQFTDISVSSIVDRAACTQDELIAMLNKGMQEIYLCGEQFTVPGNRGNITYIGKNQPVVKIDGAFVESGIDFQDLKFDLKEYLLLPIGSGGYIGDIPFFRFFEKNPKLGVKLLRWEEGHGSLEKNSIMEESAPIQAVWGVCYLQGFGVERDVKKGIELIKGTQGQAAAATYDRVMKALNLKKSGSLNLSEGILDIVHGESNLRNIHIYDDSVIIYVWKMDDIKTDLFFKLGATKVDVELFSGPEGAICLEWKVGSEEVGRLQKAFAQCMHVHKGPRPDLEQKAAATKCTTYEELGKAVKDKAAFIRIEGKAKKVYLRIREVKKAAWTVCFGALTVAVTSVIAAIATGVMTPVATLAHMVAGPSIVIATGTLGTATIPAVCIAVAAGGAAKLNTLRDDYAIIEETPSYIVLKRKQSP